eukprot:CAMPEP_0184752246 /NCGR_PEP_ID=MMETSP0315-20130426/43471_1 /TAXON_ID=101924 /ORGANISM="Rhodosorus marinus, Strain UTEX LB 2760" /LENGTH=434 /DNA_ID=CAMNT_0027231565 /DNA_START=364 /DNA_END=1668 /DNA_ORIENTATION=-
MGGAALWILALTVMRVVLGVRAQKVEFFDKEMRADVCSDKRSCQIFVDNFENVRLGSNNKECHSLLINGTSEKVGEVCMELVEEKSKGDCVVFKFESDDSWKLNGVAAGLSENCRMDICDPFEKTVSESKPRSEQELTVCLRSFEASIGINKEGCCNTELCAYVKAFVSESNEDSLEIALPAIGSKGCEKLSIDSYARCEVPLVCEDRKKSNPVRRFPSFVHINEVSKYGTAQDSTDRFVEFVRTRDLKDTMYDIVVYDGDTGKVKDVGNTFREERAPDGDGLIYTSIVAPGIGAQVFEPYALVERKTQKFVEGISFNRAFTAVNGPAKRQRFKFFYLNRLGLSGYYDGERGSAVRVGHVYCGGCFVPKPPFDEYWRFSGSSSRGAKNVAQFSVVKEGRCIVNNSIVKIGDSCPGGRYRLSLLDTLAPACTCGV